MKYQQRGIRIELHGRAFGHYELYESFKILVISLVQNAVKYSHKSSVRVYIKENDFGLQLCVESKGPLIEKSEMSSIFLKGTRGKWAAKLTSDGMGVGLYTAKTVALAHGFEIQVESSPTENYFQGAPLAENKFWIVLRPDEVD